MVRLEVCLDGFLIFKENESEFFSNKYFFYDITPSKSFIIRDNYSNRIVVDYPTFEKKDNPECLFDSYIGKKN